jgi:nifR3 family TIM-barrel protein
VTLGTLALKNNLIMAPMAGYTQRGQRMLARRYGAAMAVTEMISAYEILRPGKKTRRLLRIVDGDRPLAVQVFGADPSMMADAAARIQQLACFDLIDVNMACPVRKMIAKGNGGAMLRTPDLALAILQVMRRATTLPLTVKVRRGYDASPPSRENVERLLAGADEAGIDAVTIHGRTVDQLYHGHADWSFVAEMAARWRMPVFGSGDLAGPEAILDRLRTAGVAGVAVARGAVGHPWIFREAIALDLGQAVEPVSRAERVESMWQHYDMLRDELGDYSAIRIMRRFGMFYSKGIDRAREARMAMGKVATRDHLAEVIREFFQ